MSDGSRRAAWLVLVLALAPTLIAPPALGQDLVTLVRPSGDCLLSGGASTGQILRGLNEPVDEGAAWAAMGAAAQAKMDWGQVLPALQFDRTVLQDRANWPGEGGPAQHVIGVEPEGLADRWQLGAGQALETPQTVFWQGEPQHIELNIDVGADAVREAMAVLLPDTENLWLPPPSQPFVLTPGKYLLPDTATVGGCLELTVIPAALLPGRNPGTEMTAGTEPDAAGASRVQASLAGAYSVGFAAGTAPIDTDCQALSRATIDKCFLPSVGIVPVHDDSSVGCSGTIVGPRHVLTAAHCVCYEGKEFVPGSILVGTHGGYSGAFYDASPVFGDVVRILESDPNRHKAAVLLRVDTVAVFSGYCANGQAINDLALLTLAGSAAFPAALQAQLVKPPAPGSAINIAGFGIDPEDVKAGVVERNVKRYLSAQYWGIVDEMVRVDTPLGDSCAGDSGSGAYLRQADGSLAIFGVLSGGDKACMNGVHASYVDISHERYDAFLSAVPGFVGLSISYQPTADFALCVGDRCPGGDWPKASRRN